MEPFSHFPMKFAYCTRQKDYSYYKHKHHQHTHINNLKGILFNVWVHLAFFYFAFHLGNSLFKTTYKYIENTITTTTKTTSRL